MIKMMQFCSDLFRVNRSLMGEGNLATLVYIKGIVPELVISEVPTGYKAFDWEVPDQWEVSEAFIEDMKGNRLIDFADSNLHVVGYSTPIDEEMDFKKLMKHLFTHPELCDAIPYLTSYYQKTWGFCLSQNQLSKFDAKGTYRVVIKSKHFSGVLHSGEIFLEGKTKKEILLSTYICHPSMANNELSGPAVLTALSTWLSQIKDKHFSYRITYHSETLGALVYIKGKEEQLKENVIAAWNFTCMGGPDEISMLPTQYGNTLADKVTWKALKNLGLNPKIKNFLTRGSDERQFSSPRLGIPMVSIMKSPYGEYEEYHTSLDNLDFISEESMNEALKVMKQIIIVLEEEKYLRQTFIGEAHLNKYGLYEGIVGPTLKFKSRDVMNVMQYCDGTNTIFEISQHSQIEIELVKSILEILISKKLVE